MFHFIYIANRYLEHKTNYDECVFLDCFRVIHSKNFEFFLHSHQQINQCNVKNLKGHEKENKLFLIGKELSYKSLIEIINKNFENKNGKILLFISGVGKYDNNNLLYNGFYYKFLEPKKKYF